MLKISRLPIFLLSGIRAVDLDANNYYDFVLHSLRSAVGHNNGPVGSIHRYAQALGPNRFSLLRYSVLFHSGYMWYFILAVQRRTRPGPHNWHRRLEAVLPLLRWLCYCLCRVLAAGEHHSHTVFNLKRSIQHHLCDIHHL